MLRRLHVNNYVLIDSLDIGFPEGLVIITGQTGAGKSILLGALNLVLGAKADASVIGENGGNCVVEAEFAVDLGQDALKEIIEANDIDVPDGILVIRRVVNPTGRSRSFINDVPVTVQVLSELAAHLVDIHSQHQTLLLSDRQFRLSALDLYAGNKTLLSDYRKAYSSYLHLRSELSSLEDSLKKASDEQAYNSARYSQLESAALKEGELEALEAEQKQLANAEEIKENLCGAEELFSGDDESGRQGIDPMLKEMERQLDKVSRFIPDAASLAQRISSCRIELDDVISDVSDLESRTDVSPERLQTVEDRISLLYGLMQKFGCQDEKELIARRDELKSLISDTAAMEERRAAVAAQLDSAYASLKSLSGSLHEVRLEASVPLAASITDSLHFLELSSAVFDIRLVPSELSPNGEDTVDFLFSSTGKTPADISKCASGGEMSRIMLALKAMMAAYMSMPTMIFDEIDTGVSGSAADKMGSMICRMGKDMQVFAITHLPQVAAKGNAHYLVTKETDPVTSRTVSSIRRISGEERVLEMARMLSGSVLTDAAIDNAKALLNENSGL
ncbi:MAG: DNA repair protein RecN [Bacteroidetes bacterium]|uniref:DNA repair protein RecN n=1 Tax=Candidatus Cryptobacteroides intestinigallinarum TaxID=2840767 RepID=A0A9D9HKZ2_9BACT|nr:DNA repair protein RecN [Candidatus Cryptobacteroides intestinigallinarum]